MITLDDISMAIISLIRLGAVFRSLYDRGRMDFCRAFFQ